LYSFVALQLFFNTVLLYFLHPHPELC
jgi:hypothetical protein